MAPTEPAADRVLAVRLPSALFDDALTLAGVHGTTMGEVIRRATEAYVGRQVSSPAPSTGAVHESTEALARLAQVLSSPGVELPRTPGVAYYAVDPEDADLLLREIDGEVSRGRFVDGRFRPADDEGSR